ncbi:hypothetical protein [Rhizobium sullae]|uniref:hypothetical protein n=1 Tax=Rhizobium sullae TaxID=50338 RepID=UPI0011799C3A|nr:hypothetical protein [Rhizobium sullae]
MSLDDGTSVSPVLVISEVESVYGVRDTPWLPPLDGRGSHFRALDDECGDALGDVFVVHFAIQLAGPIEFQLTLAQAHQKLQQQRETPLFIIFNKKRCQYREFK